MNLVTLHNAHNFHRAQETHQRHQTPSPNLSEDERHKKLCFFHIFSSCEKCSSSFDLRVLREWSQNLVFDECIFWMCFQYLHHDPIS